VLKWQTLHPKVIEFTSSDDPVLQTIEYQTDAKTNQQNNAVMKYINKIPSVKTPKGRF